jgi:hypothetical protein
MQKPPPQPPVFKMSKNKMPPQLLEHFKKKEAKNEDGSEMSDKEKRKAALDKARKYKEQKKNSKDDE